METILLIDDTADILENFTEFFEMEGYKVIPSNDGKMGIRLAINFIPDIIICDVLMPGISGYEVLRILLETAQTYKIPFVFSTSLSEKIDREEALKLGADEYIIKPFVPETLLEMVRTLIKAGSKRYSL
jgi:DNA-binding response OmpR family regulator